MGNHYSMWFKDRERKLLVLSFSDVLSKAFGGHLLKKTLKIREDIGFYTEKYNFMKYDFRLFFLSAMNRHLWRHHYFGTQGIIILISSQDLFFGDKLIIETLNIFRDKNLGDIPFLLVFEKDSEEMESFIENMRSQLNNNGGFNFNLQCIKSKDEIKEVVLGMEWLAQVMKPLTI